MTDTEKPHDLGGLAAGPVDRSEHDTAYWEWQIDAMIRLAMKAGLFTDFAELRDGIERLTPEDYERSTYYERWAKSLAYTLLDKGVVAEADLADRIAQIRARQTAGS
ncbi:MAG: ScnB-like protein [Pseudomonadota bacterium]